jgi:hypothetical protein
MMNIIDKAILQGLLEKVRLRNSFLGQVRGDGFRGGGRR